MTTREFAVRIGVSQKTVCDAEGDKRPTVRQIMLNAWVEATGVSEEWLLTGLDADGNPDGLPVSSRIVPGRIADLELVP